MTDTPTQPKITPETLAEWRRVAEAALGYGNHVAVSAAIFLALLDHIAALKTRCKAAISRSRGK